MPSRAGEIGEAGAGRAVQRLGAADLLLMGAQVVGVLRRGDELRAIAGGALDQRAGALPVGLSSEVQLSWMTAARNMAAAFLAHL